METAGDGMPSEMETATEMTNGMPSEILSFIKSAEGSAALKAPQDSEAGHKAVAMMSSGNMQSSVDLVGLVEEKITLAGATIIELGPGEGFATQALVKQTPALLTVIELSRRCFEPCCEEMKFLHR